MTEPTFSTSALKSTLIDARIINTKKLKVSGKDVIKDVKYTKDTRTEVTENDIWGSYVENDKGNVIIHDDYFESIILDEDLKAKISKIENNKIYIEENGEEIFYANIETNKMKKTMEMLVDSNIKIFDSKLESLEDGAAMFAGCSSLNHFRLKELPRLINGLGMFTITQLESFDTDLSSLISGSAMFSETPLKSFKSNLCNMTDAMMMFAETQLESFDSDLSSLVDGTGMFKTSTENFKFRSYLPSLLSGWQMFDVNDMDEESFMVIADGINDLVEKGLAYHEEGEKKWSFIEDDDKWSYFSYNMVDENITEQIVASFVRGIIHFNIRNLDIESEKFKNILSYCEEISSKGWKVVISGEGLNGDNITIPSLVEEEMTKIPIPFYAKSIKVNEKIGKYKDANGDYYIILGGHKIIGDDLSDYGMFLNEEEAALNMGLTKIEK